MEDLLAERSVVVSHATIRQRVSHFGPLIAVDLRKRRPTSDTVWHLDEFFLKIDGKQLYLWRAVDIEGEVLDVFGPKGRNKHAALKLMWKLLKKYGFVPERFIMDNLRSCGASARVLGSQCIMSEVDGRIFERRIRINRFDDESEGCRASRARD